MTFLFETTNLKKSKNFCNKKGIDNVVQIEVLKGTSHRNGGLISDGKKTVANYVYDNDYYLDSNKSQLIGHWTFRHRSGH